MESTTLGLCKAAKKATAEIASLTEIQKNDALNIMADSLELHKNDILTANEKDLKEAEGTITEVMMDRLRLTPERIQGMADGIRAVASLPDPVGKIEREIHAENGIVIKKVRRPIGVIAIIYESRPNVTSDAAALAFKSGNTCVLRGGKESYRSSKAILDALKEALDRCGITMDAINLVSDLTHESANELMTATGLVDLLIPRGGAGLIRHVVSSAKVPCIQTGSGICHIYVDACADIPKALCIVNNAKTQRPSVCNAAEVCLVHKDIADEFLPILKDWLVDSRLKRGEVPVELRLDPRSIKIIEGVPAGSDDYDTEFLDYILAIKIVDSIDDAIEHISLHSTGHSEAIITTSEKNAAKFQNLVDSAAVYVNVSTRFTDGGEFGLGCEMGISTQKLHARGPMGLEELTTYKYEINGDGQIRE